MLISKYLYKDAAQLRFSTVCNDHQITMKIISLVLACYSIGQCASAALPQEYPLRMTVNHGHMLGGDVIYINGPEFKPSRNIQVTFGEYRAECITVNNTHGLCQTPMMYGRGPVTVRYISENGSQHYVANFYVEDPLSSTPYAWLENVESYNDITPTTIAIHYDPVKLDYPERSIYYKIELWGYREVENHAQWEKLYQERFSRQYYNLKAFDPSVLKNVPKNGFTSTFQMGVIKIASDNNENFLKYKSPYIWTPPIPLGWIFKSYWESFYKPLDWAQVMCKQWALEDAESNDVVFSELPCCPTTIDEIRQNLNTFVYEDECNTQNTHNTNNTCYAFSRILKCYISRQQQTSKGTQQCCYDANGKLTLDGDMQRKTGHPWRVHPFGSYTYDVAYKVPGLSHWYHDFIPYLKCCKWPQDKRTCEIYKRRRPQSQCHSDATLNFSSTSPR